MTIDRKKMRDLRERRERVLGALVAGNPATGPLAGYRAESDAIEMMRQAYVAGYSAGLLDCAETLATQATEMGLKGL